jgi:hypothetical protein
MDVKVGDWITYGHRLFKVAQVGFSFNGSYIRTYQGPEIYAYTGLKVWLPKEGDDVLMWNTPSDGILLTQYKATSGNLHKDINGAKFQYMQPFIGEYPIIERK